MNIYKRAKDIKKKKSAEVKKKFKFIIKKIIKKKNQIKKKDIYLRL